MSEKMKRIVSWIACILVAASILTAGGCAEAPKSPVSTLEDGTWEERLTAEENSKTEESLGGNSSVLPDGENLSTEKTEPSSIPSYTGSPFVVLQDNKPAFTASEITATAFESYSDLDALGRCGTAFASCGKEIMPKEGEERGSISSIKPSGWVQAQYDSVSGKYLYNRCHLIGWQLSAENANKKNLITGTKYFNVEGMLHFENMIADYIKETGNHVMYRVTPIYQGNNLVASGVRLEAYSVEDSGEGICFHVYCYNVQPGIRINYATGESALEGAGVPPASPGTVSTTTAHTHSYSAATCTTPKTCTGCGSAEGSALGHGFANGVCSRCGAKDPSFATEQMVWIPTKGGTKYHSNSSCSGMIDPLQVTISEAARRGFNSACKKCY